MKYAVDTPFGFYKTKQAARPELLEARKDMLKLYDAMVKFVGSMALQDYQLLNEAPVKARAAIDKAEGDSA